MCSMKCPRVFLLILLSIQAGNDSRQLLTVRNVVMEASAGVILCVEANFHKVANWADRRLLCNVLHMGVLVRRPLGIDSGRTEPTVETLGTPCS